MGLVREVLALSRAATQHLLEQDAGLHRPQKDDAFQIGNVHASREHINRHNDARRRAIAELADVLKRTIHAPVIF